MQDWIRLYQTPLWLAAGFIVVLTLFALAPNPSRTAAEVGPDTTAEPTPGPRECIICPIDQQCDPQSGRCVFVEVTPLPCVRGAQFDEQAGFCLPTGAPTPPPTPLVTEAPEIDAEEREIEEPLDRGRRDGREPVDEENSDDDRRDLREEP